VWRRRAGTATSTPSAPPALRAVYGVGPDTAATLLTAIADNPNRICSDAAFAKLCGVCPLEAASGKTIRHRLNRGGNRDANRALHVILVVRMRRHEPTRDYFARPLAEGKTKNEIMRCVKRYIARDLPRPPTARQKNQRTHCLNKEHLVFSASVTQRGVCDKILGAVQQSALDEVQHVPPREFDGCGARG
jgi:hypothetical protein